MWHLQRDGQVVGPFSDQQMKALCDTNAIHAGTLVWKTGLASWRPLAETDFPYADAVAAPPAAPVNLAAPSVAPVNHVFTPPRYQLGGTATPRLSLWQHFVRCMTAKYARFEGRATRREYWSFALFYLLAMFFLCFAGAFIDGAAGNLTGNEHKDKAIFLSLFLLIFLLGTVLPSLAVMVRRFHDAGFTGWLALLSFIPGIGGLIVFVFMLIPSEATANKFGAYQPG